MTAGGYYKENVYFIFACLKVLLDICYMYTYICICILHSILALGNLGEVHFLIRISNLKNCKSEELFKYPRCCL